MNGKRKYRVGAWCAASVAVLFLSSCEGETKLPEKPKTTVRVEKADFVDHRQMVTLTGEVVAHVQTNLSFRVSGQITEWHVDVGSHVTVGEVLARIDPSEQKADVEASEAAVRAAEARVKQASSAFERQRLLLSRNSTTQETFDLAETTLRTAQGSLDSAKAQLGTARDALSYTELRADADGIVTVRNAEAGQVVQAAQTMFTVARDGPRDAIFDVYESLLFQRPAEPKIGLALVSDPSVKTEGSVREISPSVDTVTGTVRVKIAMDSTPERMTLGAPVIGFASSQPVKLVILPWTSLSALDGKPAVWVVDQKDSTVNLKPVTVASYETGRVLISDGIAKGDTVVIDGGKMLRPGQVVDIAKEQAK
ncbi:efflux RND transporter periplasmic adaptor subunit [Pararhizobium sp. BT-229]|uniref:efflux RND transporter periplasmic adaptor subunit n=1 Tax=Pararhizobium sp. BT-229 TaxID=2986923 RepID=UPI0021F7C020|nr:efflux RND transporter periplasmic adaptor subunit [Pararhizobium sp. BT-229]MCV9961541.1 efflux RND transporter periplasmic adaptor subunit [Pararhizobium sp. BT-229]